MAANDQLYASRNGVALRYAAAPTALVFKTLNEGESAGVHTGYVLNVDGQNYLNVTYPNEGGLFVLESEVKGLSGSAGTVVPTQTNPLTLIRNRDLGGTGRTGSTGSGTSGGYTPTAPVVTSSAGFSAVLSSINTTQQSSGTIKKGLLGIGNLLGQVGSQPQVQAVYVPAATAADPNPAPVPVVTSKPAAGGEVGQLLGGSVGWILGMAGLLIVVLFGAVVALAGRDND